MARLRGKRDGRQRQVDPHQGAAVVQVARADAAAKGARDIHDQEQAKAAARAPLGGLIGLAELIQHAATAETLAEAMWKQLSDAPHRVQLVQRFTDMHHSLLRNSAEESAAAVLKVINQ